MKTPNINLSSITKALKYGEGIHPVRDWLYLLTFAFVLLIVGVGWNVWIFVQLENGKTVGPAPAVQVSATTTSVANVQQVFQKRATQEAAYQNTLHFSDPSLAGSQAAVPVTTTTTPAPAASTTQTSAPH